MFDAPAGTDCIIRAADPEQLPPLALEWVECGPACERASVDGGLLDPNYFPSIPGEAFVTVIPADNGPAVLLSYSQQALASDHRVMKMRRILDLSGTAIDEAVQVFGSQRECTLIRGPSAVIVHLITGKPLRDRYALLDPIRSSWGWSDSWGSTNLPLCSSSSAVLPEGQMLAACGEVLAALDPSNPVFTSIRPGRVVMVQGLGELAMMAELAPDAPGTDILSWTHASGFEPVVSGIEGDTCGLAVSSTRVAGIAGEPYRTGGACFGTYAGSRLWSFSRDDPERVSYGPVLHEKAVLTTGVATWGDWVATRAWAEEANDDFVALAHLPDWRTRVIRYSEGTAFVNNVLALDDRYLYIGMTRTKNLEQGRLAWVERYDLSRFDEIGVPLDR